jgi:23S rRNA (adenine-C8)-methyltransferase
MVITFNNMRTKESFETNFYLIIIKAGCALACNFCATGMIGFKKNLTVDQITDQILYFLQKKDQIQSVAFMGMGEPLLNPNIFPV